MTKLQAGQENNTQFLKSQSMTFEIAKQFFHMTCHRMISNEYGKSFQIHDRVTIQIPDKHNPDGRQTIGRTHIYQNAIVTIY
jgi:predicted naringenin-chalcone synthase